MSLKTNEPQIDDLLSGARITPTPPPEPPPEDEVPRPMEFFKGGRISFRSRFAEQMMWPLGGSVTRLVTELGGNQRTVVDAKPEVKFAGHMYATENREIALAMVSNEGFFEKSCGYHVNAECLPPPLAGKYQELAIENRRRVCVALIGGKNGTEALATIDQKLQHVIEAENAPVTSTALICPVPGCGREVSGKSKGAKAALILHVRTQHPEFTGSIG